MGEAGVSPELEMMKLTVGGRDRRRCLIGGEGKGWWGWDKGKGGGGDGGEKGVGGSQRCKWPEMAVVGEG